MRIDRSDLAGTDHSLAFSRTNAILRFSQANVPFSFADGFAVMSLVDAVARHDASPRVCVHCSPLRVSATSLAAPTAIDSAASFSVRLPSASVAATRRIDVARLFGEIVPVHVPT